MNCDHDWRKVKWDTSFGEQVTFVGEYHAIYRTLYKCAKCGEYRVKEETGNV